MKSMGTLAALLATVGTGACMMSGGPAGPVVNEHHAVDRGAATAVNVVIDMSAGDLDVKAGATTLFEGDFAYNVPTLKPEIAYAVTGTTGNLKVSQGSSSGNTENRWSLSLDDTTPIDLDHARRG